jgi:hypothetical protein
MSIPGNNLRFQITNIKEVRQHTRKSGQSGCCTGIFWNKHSSRNVPMMVTRFSVENICCDDRPVAEPIRK